MDKISIAEKNRMAALYGLLIGIIYIVITSVVNLKIDDMIMFYVFKTIGYIIYFIIIGYFARSIKRANGGFIEFKEIFGAIFIMILIAATISYVYNYVYMYYIDPNYMDKIKKASIDFMVKLNAPDDQIDATAEKFDGQMAEMKKFSLWKNLLTLSGAYVIDSLFGLIVAVIVRKKKPIVDNF